MHSMTQYCQAQWLMMWAWEGFVQVWLSTYNLLILPATWLANIVLRWNFLSTEEYTIQTAATASQPQQAMEVEVSNF